MSETALFEPDPAAPDSHSESNGHKIVIIDGHALAYRSYFAIRELSNSQGRSTNAIFGFLRSLLRILKEEGEFDATIVTFDAPAKTFRHEQYGDYKAGRAPAPDDLPEQIRTIKRVVDLLGLYRTEVPGLEADDLFGTIAKRCEVQGYSVEIVTGDRDAYQLVSERVCVRGLDKKDRFGPKEVFDKYGVTVEQWVDYRALTGDSSDNIPGAKGIGPVSAKKLLQNYGSLDYILAHLDEVEPKKFAEKVEASLEDVKFSRELSRIVTDADINIDPKDWAKREMAKDELRDLLAELEFGSIARELGLSAAATASGEHDYQQISSADIFFGGAYGYVLSEQSPMRAELTEIAVAAARTVAPIAEEWRGSVLSSEEVLNACDAKALTVYARKQGLKVTPGDDPLLMAYVLDPNTASPEALARRYGTPDWGVNAISRAVVTAELLKTLPEKLTPELKHIYEAIEKPLQDVLADMEYCGVEVDVALLKAQSDLFATQLETLENKVRAIADNPELNLNSRDQLADLLFDKLNLQAGRKTSTGKRSTSVQALEPLRDEHEIIAMILDYRELSKLKNTYLDPLPALLNPDTGRIHTTFNQTVTTTGRLSSANPNLQNIPIRTEIGREIRKAFIAGKGEKLLVADYSQIELRILAHVTGEAALLETFRTGEDIHRRTAAQIFDTGMDTVDATMRRVAKIINFGVLYGMSAHRLTRELGIEYKDADAFITAYFERYPKVQAYIDDTLAFASKHGYVETLLGRRRYIPDINSKNRNAREYAERTAYNMPIQGTQADIMKIAMVELAPRLRERHARITLQVHDELVIEAPAESTAEVSQLVKETMENAYQLDVPIVAEVGVGENWLEAK